MLNTIANQLNISASCINHFDWEGRSTKDFVRKLANLLGYRKATLDDVTNLKEWLIENVFLNNVKSHNELNMRMTYFRNE